MRSAATVTAEQPFQHGGGRAGDRDDAAVVVPVAALVKQENARRLYGRDDGLDYFRRPSEKLGTDSIIWLLRSGAVMTWSSVWSREGAEMARCLPSYVIIAPMSEASGGDKPATQRYLCGSMDDAAWDAVQSHAQAHLLQTSGWAALKSRFG